MLSKIAAISRFLGGMRPTRGSDISANRYLDAHQSVLQLWSRFGIIWHRLLTRRRCASARPSNLINCLSKVSNFERIKLAAGRRKVKRVTSIEPVFRFKRFSCYYERAYCRLNYGSANFRKFLLFIVGHDFEQISQSLERPLSLLVSPFCHPTVTS